MRWLPKQSGTNTSVSSHSETFRLLHKAILERRQITCLYDGHRREICPYILGHTGGKEKVLTFQFAGESSSKLPSGGQWRCFSLEGISELRMREGRWHGGSSHRAPQKCVDVVYIDVNTDVPDQPGRT